MRQEKAAKIAAPQIRGVQAWMALDLWMALGLDPDAAPESVFAEWPAMLAKVRQLRTRDDGHLHVWRSGFAQCIRRGELIHGGDEADTGSVVAQHFEHLKSTIQRISQWAESENQRSWNYADAQEDVLSILAQEG